MKIWILSGLPQIEIGVASICTIYRARFRGFFESLLSLRPPSSSSPTTSPSLSASSPFSLCPTSASPSSSWSRSAPPRATRPEIRSESDGGGCSLCLTGRRCRSRSEFALLAWCVKRSQWHGSPDSSATGEVFCQTLSGVYGLQLLDTKALALVNGEWMCGVCLWFDFLVFLCLIFWVCIIFSGLSSSMFLMKRMLDLN